jgi:carbonic anhydrase
VDKRPAARQKATALFALFTRGGPVPIQELFDNNRLWAEKKIENDSDFFKRLARQQAPEFLWIGCSDSRVPANEIVGLDPGELFVHRNVANMVVASDMNLLSVLQFAVDILKVRHIIVSGHYGCGGVAAALSRVNLGLIDNWLQPIKRTYLAHRDELDALELEPRRDRLSELNVAEQVRNVAATTIVQDAWLRGQKIAVHGWIYGLKDGYLRNLSCTISSAEQIDLALRVDVPKVNR